MKKICLVFLAFGLMACSKKHEPYTFDQEALTVTKAMVKQELSYYLQGESQFIKFDKYFTKPMLVNAKEISREYEANEVSSDEKYKGKFFLIDGKVESINKTIGDSAYINFLGHKWLQEPRAYVNDNYIQAASVLRKGETVRLACRGFGMSLMAPLLKDCISADRFAENQYRKFEPRLDAWLNGEEESPFSKQETENLLSVYFAVTQVPAEAQCNSFLSKDCLIAIKKVLDDQKKDATKFHALRNKMAEKIKISQLEQTTS